MMFSSKLSIGNKIRLSGGYDYEPRWLSGKDHVDGHLVRFIPGQNKEDAAVVRLDSMIVVDDCAGDIVILELRHVGGSWEKRGTVHIELCDFEPESKTWKDRRQGKWVESHATFEKIS